MHHRAACRAYVVDPTLEIQGRVSGAWRSGDRAVTRDFEISLQAYGATLNSSIGVGDPQKANGTISDGGEVGVVHFPVVSLWTLLRDHYGPPPWRLDAMKMDVEGNERGVLNEAFGLCAAGQLTIRQLNVEMHAAPKW